MAAATWNIHQRLAFPPTHIFLATVWELYDKVIDRAISDQDYSMEDEAFSRMLSSRVKIENGQALFLLFDLENAVVGTPPSLFVEIEDRQYLRVDCL